MAKARLEKERSATPSAPDPWWAKKMQSGLAGADVILQVTLDGRDLESIDLAGLREGQVLELRGTDKTVGIECGGQALFKALLGQGGGFLDFTLAEAMRNHDKFLDDILLNAVLS